MLVVAIPFCAALGICAWFGKRAAILLMLLPLACAGGLAYARASGPPPTSSSVPVAPYAPAVPPRSIALFSAHLPAAEAGLLDGIVLSERAAIPKDVVRDLTASGMLHIVNFSGYKIGLFVFLLFGCFAAFLPRRYATAGSVAAVAALAVAAGGSVTAVRAAIVACLALLARELGRPYSMPYALLWAVFVIVLFDPSAVDSAGLRLSVASVLGIVHLGPVVRRWFGLPDDGYAGGAAARFTPGIRANAVVSVAAQLAAAPVMLDAFGTFSAGSFLANALAMPLVPLLLLGGLVLAAADAVLPGLGWLVAAALRPALDYEMALAHLFAAGEISVPFTLPWYATVCYYLALVWLARHELQVASYVPFSTKKK